MTLSFQRPLLMGILNITPDSFSDGGQFLDPEKALQQITQLKSDGADIIDIGAQSTFGPEALIDADEEWQRLEPVLSAIDFSETFVSLDTFRAPVAEKALSLGVQMINDVTALRGDPELREVLLKHKPWYAMMYSAYETPYAQKEMIHYEDVISDISAFLRHHADQLTEAGFPKDHLIVDPGLGFFISAEAQYSWEILARLDELEELGYPILVGPSMKSFLGVPIEERHEKTLEASELALKNGAKILRVHHLPEHRKLVDDSSH